MPQMGPLLWLYLMLMILVVFSLFIMLNYFFYLPVKTKVSQGLVDVENKSWKW